MSWNPHARTVRDALAQEGLACVPGQASTWHSLLRWDEQGIVVVNAGTTESKVIDRTTPATLLVGRATFTIADLPESAGGLLKRVMAGKKKKSAKEQRLYVELRTEQECFHFCATPKDSRWLVGLTMLSPQGEQRMEFDDLWDVLQTARFLGASLELGTDPGSAPRLRRRRSTGNSTPVAPRVEIWDPTARKKEPKTVPEAGLERAISPADRGRFIVAVYSLPEPTEALERAYANAAGLSAYETRMRLRVLAGMPTVMGVFQQEELARERELKLREGGYSPVVLFESEVETDAERFVVKEFDFVEGGMGVVSFQDERVLLPFKAITHLVLGLQNSRHKFAETTARVASRSAPVRGLIKKTTERKVREEDSPFFLLLCKEHAHSFIFPEQITTYLGLPEGMVQNTKAANFKRLMNLLKTRCPHLIVDERLAASRNTRKNMMSVQLDLAQNFDVVITLVIRDLWAQLDEDEDDELGLIF